MTKLEALPFDPERWPALQAEGYTLGFGGHPESTQDLHFLACSKGEIATKDRHGNLSVDPVDNFVMVPPVSVIEFKVGLFKKYGGYLVEVVNSCDKSKELIRLLTDDERAKGEVRVEG